MRSIKPPYGFKVGDNVIAIADNEDWEGKIVAIYKTQAWIKDDCGDMATRYLRTLRRA